MRKGKVNAEIRRLFMNGKTVQACLPTPMVEKAGLGKGGQIVVIQKRRGADLELKDNDIIIRAADLLFQ